MYPGVHLGKTGEWYVRARKLVRAIRVHFFITQKSLKGVQINKLASEWVRKSGKSKISLSKGHDFQKFRQEFGENQKTFEKIDQNLGKSLSKGPQNIKILSL